MMDIWHEETDVVVVGYGGAGAAAAISAHDAGVNVIILEKDSGGGNTRLATNAFLCPIKNTSAKEHLRALSSGTVIDEIIDTFLEWSSRNTEFIKDLGGDVDLVTPGPTFSSLIGSETMVRYRVKGPSGERGGVSLWNLLSKNVQQRKIRVCEGTAAKKLLRSGDEVVGVEAEEKEGKRIRIGAKKAVVLATGGFEFNETMKREYLWGYPIYAFGHAGNQGDGVKLAQEVGADLWHMKSVAAPMGYKFSEYEAAFAMQMPANGYIIVDQHGRRFCNETGLEHYSMWMEVTRFDIDTLGFSRIPSYLIFDDQTRLSGPITQLGHGANRDYNWSADNSEEVRRGWIRSGESPMALASGLGIGVPEQLAKTLTAYQGYCKQAKDEEFARTRETLIELRGRLFGVPLWPCLLNTQGGPKRNPRGQILDIWGQPIKRLYGAGELGSIWGFLYQSGGNLGECLASGRMAGFNAASERPQS
jgi:succinate dehydrogenase/fumarate reductase flavoprotein subunit